MIYMKNYNWVGNNVNFTVIFGLMNFLDRYVFKLKIWKV
jgi:hypothetical protein